MIEPLLLTVRFHPSLLLDSREKELSKERWASNEPHDFFGVLQKISLSEILSQDPWFIAEGNQTKTKLKKIF